MRVNHPQVFQIPIVLKANQGKKTIKLLNTLLPKTNQLPTQKNPNWNLLQINTLMKTTSLLDR